MQFWWAFFLLYPFLFIFLNNYNYKCHQLFTFLNLLSLVKIIDYSPDSKIYNGHTHY